MKFKHQQAGAKLPEINLIPMLNVMMAVLAFFVMISMTLTNAQQSVDVQLPSQETEEIPQDTPDPLIIELNQNGEIFLNSQPMTQEQILEEIQAYLMKTPKGIVLLDADNNLPYEQVVQLLGEMRDVGGEQVSLGIE